MKKILEKFYKKYWRRVCEMCGDCEICSKTGKCTRE